MARVALGILGRGGRRAGGRRCFALWAVALLLAAAWPAAAQWLHAAPGGGGAAPVVAPQIVRTVRHDPSAFTQGLLFRDSLLYESTGLVGFSSLRRVDPRSGAPYVFAVGGDYFAEGIAVLGGELVQLTWKNGVALRYEFPTLRRGARPSFSYKGEGWGLTSDENGFIMSNGSDTLYFRDKKFEVTRAVPVKLNGRPLVHLNELEYARGLVYANVWYKDFIAEISAESGAVKRVIDCSELLRAENPPVVDHVLNGIAYDERADEWYLTGKNWRNIFVVKIPK